MWTIKREIKVSRYIPASSFVPGDKSRVFLPDKTILGVNNFENLPEAKRVLATMERKDPWHKYWIEEKRKDYKAFR